MHRDQMKNLLLDEARIVQRRSADRIEQRSRKCRAVAGWKPTGVQGRKGESHGGQCSGPAKLGDPVGCASKHCLIRRLGDRSWDDTKGMKPGPLQSCPLTTLERFPRLVGF